MTSTTKTQTPRTKRSEKKKPETAINKTVPVDNPSTVSEVPTSSHNDVENYIRKPFQQISDPFADFEIPETWETIEEFAEWWMQSRMPTIFPSNPIVYLSDDATAICLFRKGRFQVEMYLIHPQPGVPVHEHPGVEVIKIRAGGATKGTVASAVLRNGETHGSGMRLEAEVSGFPLLAIQHWLTRKPTTIASMWKGTTAGPKHEALIRRYNPDAYIKDGYADITRKYE